MKLVRISYESVRAECVDDSPVHSFNTSFHHNDEIPSHLDVCRPSEAPYSFRRWLPLILKTRGLDESAVQIVQLSTAQAKLVVDASAGSIITGEISRAYMEDLQEELLPAFSSLHFPTQGLFMRLAACSPKDGKQQVDGRLSVHSADEVLLRLTTSQRARNSVIKELEGSSSTVDVFLLPFDGRMKSNREYRVYCRPGTGAIVAISQYCWHKPWVFSENSPEEMGNLAESIFCGVEDVHFQILNALRPDDEVDQLLLRQGFSFDVFFDHEQGTFALVELNVFGARSGCGSCLFHWIKDIHTLYGGGDEVEFRVTY